MTVTIGIPISLLTFVKPWIKIEVVLVYK